MYLATKLCCLCLKNDKITTNVHNTDIDNIKIIDKLLFCIPELTYNISHHLVNICSICHSNLNLLYHFKNTCMRNYKEFLDFITIMEKSKINENDFKDLTITVPECSNQQTDDYPDNNTEIITQNDCISEIIPIKEEKDDYTFIEEEKIIIDVETKQGTEENNCLTNEQYSNTSNSNTFDSSAHQTVSSDRKTIGKKKAIRKGSTLSNLTNPEKMFSCAICQRPFSRKDNLNIHQRLHTGERPFPCSICHKYFPHRNTLKVHLRTHTGEKPYFCTFCDQRFRHKCNLNNHMRIHTGERPYSCPICQKLFSSNNKLRAHEKSHGKEKGVTCSICKKKFFNANDLSSHLNVHSNIKKLDS